MIGGERGGWTVAVDAGVVLAAGGTIEEDDGGLAAG